MAMTAPGTSGKLSGREHLGRDDADAGMGQGGGRRVAEVEDPAVDVRAPVVDEQQHAATVLRDQEQGAERQLLAGARPTLLVVDGAAGRGPAVEARPVPRRRAGE